MAAELDLPDPVLDVDPGKCCACEKELQEWSLILLPFLATAQGTGWGCFVCDLPRDGAFAVLCPECLKMGCELKYAVDGPLGSFERIPIGHLSGRQVHDEELHPETKAQPQYVN